MKVKALKSFSGVVSMYKGEVREIIDVVLIRDLAQAGYIEQVTVRKGVKNESERDND